MSETLSEVMGQYKNSAEHNDAIYSGLTAMTDRISYLRKHRDFVEQNQLGFGDRAFHAMWKMILEHLAKNHDPVEALEIGVYKGQVISLWALLARELRLPVSITAISPFQGNTPAMSRIGRRLRSLLSPRYRQQFKDGNLYAPDDYLACVKRLFSEFNLDLESCELIKGLSTDAGILERMRQRSFSVIYVDGDHSYEAVASDIRSYGPLVRPGGFLVMDDASCFVPGTVFWKGRESVSRACELIPALGFRNVLNVGHDRLYLRQQA